MTPDSRVPVLMGKAGRALASARLLLDAGDPDGACNRAYYAVFDAARAALLAADAPVKADIGKTHSGLMIAFIHHLVKTGILPRELGRLLKRAEEARLVADYRQDSVDLTDAAAIVGEAALFVSAIGDRFGESKL